MAAPLSLPLETSTSTVGSKSLYFNVPDWNRVLPVVQEYMTTTENSLSKPVFYDWTRSGDQLVWQSTFDDVNTMISSFNSITPLVDAMRSGGATVGQVNFHAPNAWMPIIQAASASLPLANYYETPYGMSTGCFSKTGNDVAPTGGAFKCSSHPTFKILNWEAAKELTDEFITRTRLERRCIYFGWTRSGDSLFWQAHFVDGDALRFHLQAVRGLYDALIEGDERPTDLVRFELHGPQSELEKCRGIAQGLDPIYFFPEQRIERIKED